MKKLSFLTITLAVISHLAFAGKNIQKPLPDFTKFSPPATSFTVNEIINTSLSVPIPCTGDVVMLEGTLHSLSHVTINGNRVVIKTHLNPQNLTGISQNAGTKYQATGETQDIFTGSLINGQFSYSYVNNFKIIGQGPGNNYLVHENYHVTVNANGTLTTEIDNFSVECK